MTDRVRFGVIIPSVNTTVEDEYNWMRPEGVSFHAGRLYVKKDDLSSDKTFEDFLEPLRAEMAPTVERLMSCRPDHVIMGMSAETFWEGREGNRRFHEMLEGMTRVGVSSGAASCAAALDAIGAKRIGIVTPYQPVGDEQVRRFFTESGFDVATIEGFRCPSGKSIAETPADEVERGFRSVDRDDVEALVQAGTNLRAATIAAKVEEDLGKPVIAINTASVWHALRTNGVDTKVDGFGCLLSKY